MLIAAITIVISGLLAFVQNDIKKVLAYSTVGQLGYMMLGLGAGAWLPAVFHIFTHAFFKCSLFLCAGSVSHSGSHHSFDMKQDMGGLAKKMPITATCWIICSLALAGVFPLAGFFSKDEIIDNVGHNGYTVFMWVALIGAFLTAAYTVRATYLTFFGEPRGAAASGGDEAHGAEMAAAISSHDIAHDIQQEGELEADAAHGHAGAVALALEEHDDHGGGTVPTTTTAGHQPPHESGKLILVPIVILTFCAVVAGFANATPFGESWENFKKHVEPRADVVLEAEAATDDEATAGILRVAADDDGEGEETAAAEGEEAHATGCGFEAPEEGAACYAPTISHAEFKWAKAALSLIIVGVGLLVSWFVCVALYTRRDRRLVGLTDRSRLARAGYTFLANKYYLDALYEGVIVRFIAHPLARAFNWINQNVIDAVVNGAGRSGRKAGGLVYRNIDQRVVDGAVNGSGAVANSTGSALRPVQSGRVNQYGALLFGAAAVGAVVLVIVNV